MEQQGFAECFQGSVQFLLFVLPFEKRFASDGTRGRDDFKPLDFALDDVEFFKRSKIFSLRGDQLFVRQTHLEQRLLRADALTGRVKNFGDDARQRGTHFDAGNSRALHDHGRYGDRSLIWLGFQWGDFQADIALGFGAQIEVVVWFLMLVVMVVLMSRVLLCRFIGMVVFVLLIMGVCGMFFCRFASVVFFGDTLLISDKWVNGLTGKEFFVPSYGVPKTQHGEYDNDNQESNNAVHNKLTAQGIMRLPRENISQERARQQS
jgi:hypothetical protein